MMRFMKSCLRLVALLAFTIAAGLVVRMPPVDAAAADASVTQTCGSAGADVTFSWSGNDVTALQQWLDISTTDGWAAGSFLSAGPFSGSTRSYRWTGLAGNTQHYFRLNQQLGDGSWDASGSFTFTTNACTPVTTASAPAPAQPSPAAGGQEAYTMELLGFSDQSTNSASIVPSGGTLRSCTPPAIYVYIKATSNNGGIPFAAPLVWSFNSTKIEYVGGYQFNPATGLIIAGLPTSLITVNRANASGTYEVSRGGPTPVQGSVTVTC
jgi:hypothetical protein